MSKQYKRVKDSISEEFKAFSANYTEDMIKCVPFYLDILNSMVTDLPGVFYPDRILDLGSGNGNVVDLLRRRYPAAKYVLVDASAEMLKICEARFPQLEMQLIESYFEQYHFLPEAFDLITAGFSLHHIDSAAKASIFKKISNSLRPGGHFTYGDLMISKRNKDHPALIESWGQFIKGNYPDEEKWQWIMEHYEAFDKPDDIEDQLVWLSQAGFSSVSISWREGYWIGLHGIK